MLISLFDFLGVSKFWNSITVSIVTGIYQVASRAFGLFIELAKGLIINQESYRTLINNSYIIIGIAMLFILAFSLLRGMVDDDSSKKSATNIRKTIVNLITSSVIIALLPAIFTFAYNFQSSIIEQDTIGKFFAGNSAGNVNSGMYSITNDVFRAFFVCENDSGECTVNEYNSIVNDVSKDGNFSLYNALSDDVADGNIQFNFLVSLIAGLILIWVGVSFCFDMGIRYVKLLFYQIIAPVPVFLRAVPEGKMSSVFDNWLKVTLACYFEVYVRIFAIFTTVFVYSSMSSAGIFGGDGGLFKKAFILMGIVVFMRQLPKLVSDVTGIDTGNMKLGIREKLKEGGAFAAGAVIGGGVTAAARNFTSGTRDFKNKWAGAKSAGQKVKLLTGIASSTFAGAVSGGVRSGKAGWKAGSYSDMKNAAGKGAAEAVDARDRRETYRASHGNNMVGVIKGHVSDSIYDVGRWAGLNNISNLQAQDQLIDKVQADRKAVDNAARDLILGDMEKRGKTSFAYDGIGGKNMTQLRTLKAKMDAAQSSGSENEILKTSQDYNKYLKDWQDEIINTSLKGTTGWNKLVLKPDGSVDEAATRKLQAELSSVRMATDKYRETVSQNITASFVSNLSEQSKKELLDRNADLSVNHEMLDNIKDNMKIEQTNIRSEINRIQQKNAERDKNK